jgi:heme oxygenase (mycobilin-producing)
MHATHDPCRLSRTPAVIGLPRLHGFERRRDLAAGMIVRMTVVKINAITVPADSGDELARRFAARAGAVDSQDGFEGFELLKPADGRTTWLVVTRWRDDESFKAWVNSPAFGHGHRSAAERAGGEAPHPVGISSELWSYEIAGGSAAT